MVPEERVIIKSLSKKRNYWLIGTVVSMGIGGYFKYSADKHYDEYLTATSNAGDLHNTIDQEDLLNQILIGSGGISLIHLAYYQEQIMSLRKILNVGIIRE